MAIVKQAPFENKPDTRGVTGEARGGIGMVTDTLTFSTARGLFGDGSACTAAKKWKKVRRPRDLLAAR